MHAERFEMTLNTPRGTGAPRSTGVHVSNLIRGLAIETGILKIKDRLDELSLVDVNQEAWWSGLDHSSRLRISIGLAWEEWYLGQLAETVVKHPGEMCVEGVYMTHDGESLDLVASESKGKHVMAIHEVKATYKSVNTVWDITSPKNWMWRMQMMAYCKGKNTCHAWLHVLHLAGGYDFPIEPVGHVWRFTFDQTEIDESWDRLTQYRDYRLSLQAETDMKDTYNAR